MSNNRLLYIDFLKGIAIFLMVMGHFLYGLHMPNNNGQYIIAQIIYTFHMPLFMFVSGYVFDLNNKYKWNSGFVISQILEGQLRVEDSIKMLVCLIK